MEAPTNLGITLNWPEYDALQKLAHKRHCSRAEIIRIALRMYLEKCDDS